MWGVIKDHRETYDENNIRDLVDLYIQAERNNFEGIGAMDGKTVKKYTQHVLKSASVFIILTWMVYYMYHITQHITRHFGDFSGEENLHLIRNDVI